MLRDQNSCVEGKINSVQKDLDAALTFVEKAMDAFAGLNIDDFSILKALFTPPADIGTTFT